MEIFRIVQPMFSWIKHFRDLDHILVTYARCSSTKGTTQQLAQLKQKIPTIKPDTMSNKRE